MIRQSGMTCIRLADRSIIPVWLELAAEVTDVFESDMASDPEFHAYMARSLERQQVLVGYLDGVPAGIITFSQRRNAIAWLSVFVCCRNQGVGSALVSRAINCLDQTQPIEVITFRSGHGPGEAARHLYAKIGFKETDATMTHNGKPRALMELHPGQC